MKNLCQFWSVPCVDYRLIRLVIRIYTGCTLSYSLQESAKVNILRRVFRLDVKLLMRAV
ncbi:MAG: hypothetical protein LBL39_07265 [Planctomycetaceae bacterium]|nr:hypothetical protein [Planctomycetaceae bacterium]